MDKRHQRKTRFTKKTDKAKHKNRVGKQEKTECAICEQEFTPENEKDTVCRLDACQSYQANIDCGESDVPSWHPDYVDKTEDEEYLRLPSTDDEAISAEKERVVGIEKKRQRPQNFLGGKDYTNGPGITRDHWIEDHDGGVVREYQTIENRKNAFLDETTKTRALKAHLNSVIKKYARSG